MTVLSSIVRLVEVSGALDSFVFSWIMHLSHTLSVYVNFTDQHQQISPNQPIHRGKCVYGGVDPWKGPPFIGKGSKGTPKVDHMGMGQNSIPPKKND